VIFVVHDVYEHVPNGGEPLHANPPDAQRNTHKDAKKKKTIRHCFSFINMFMQMCFSKVKKVKLQAIKRQYELMEMMNEDKYVDCFVRLVTLTNQMKNCGEEMRLVVIMKKVLSTLTSQFDLIVVTIEETKELSEVKIEDLQSTLEAHELKFVERKHGKVGDHET